MKANNIEEYFGTLQQSMVESWKEHLKTDKYSKHVALNEFYDDIVELVDTIIEDYQGIHGKVGDLKNLLSAEPMGAIEYLETLKEFADSGKDLLGDDTELHSDLDAILSCIDRTLYKLKELTESKNSLVSFLNENIKSNIATICESFKSTDLKRVYDALKAEGINMSKELPVTFNWSDATNVDTPYANDPEAAAKDIRKCRRNCSSELWIGFKDDAIQCIQCAGKSYCLTDNYTLRRKTLIEVDSEYAFIDMVKQCNNFVHVIFNKDEYYELRNLRNHSRQGMITYDPDKFNEIALANQERYRKIIKQNTAKKHAGKYTEVCNKVLDAIDYANKAYKNLLKDPVVNALRLTCLQEHVYGVWYKKINMTKLLDQFNSYCECYKHQEEGLNFTNTEEFLEKENDLLLYCDQLKAEVDEIIK